MHRRAAEALRIQADERLAERAGRRGVGRRGICQRRARALILWARIGLLLLALHHLLPLLGHRLLPALTLTATRLSERGEGVVRKGQRT